MKKISRTAWNRYKESAEGQEVISLFKKMTTDECSHEEILEISKRFDPELFKNYGKKEEKVFIAILKDYENILADILSSNNINLEAGSDYINFYYNFLLSLFPEECGDDFEELPQKGFKNLLGNNIMMSIALYSFLPGFFIPNFFVMQFALLERFAEKYEIELPEIPNRSDYRSRCLYYLELCISIVNFAADNGIEDSSEICAFIYGCELPVIREELEADFEKPMPKVPEQAWILVGNYGEGEKNMEHGFWQANELTSKGDILLFYEKSPVKKLNSVWIALKDGVKDPFFYYYSNTYIGRKIEIPSDQAITFDEFKNSKYFKERDKKGNFVSKNFQDVSGWEVTTEDYAEIKRMLEAKGFDTSVLPSLYEPKVLAGVDIKLEADVSKKLLIPRLEEMGWKEGVDFFPEVEFPAGRGKTGHKMEKRPDFCLHMTGSDKDLGAKVVIEVKLHMKNTEEVNKNYYQGLSYAKYGNAQVLVICDKNQIRVYQRDAKGNFNIKKFIKFYWEELQDLSKFNELKNLIDI